MKKKQRCFVKRFAALVAALCLSFSFMLPFVSASSDMLADMPSDSDFKSHYGSWFVWRKFSLNSVSYYELLNSPISVSSSDSYSLPFSLNYCTFPFELNYISDSSASRTYYACSYPTPIRGASGYWNSLPSFPVGSSNISSSCVVRVYSNSALSSDTFLFLTPAYTSSDHLLSFGNSLSSSSGSTSDTFDSATFYSPFYSYPFAWRTVSPNSGNSYSLVGGSNSSVVPPSSFSSPNYLSLSSSYFLSRPSSLSPYPYGAVVPSSNLGVVIVKKPSYPSGGIITSVDEFSTSAYLSFSLCVPVGMLSDVKIGDWLSDSPEDLQDAITNEFGVDSDKLKDSKDSITDWSNTSSVDSDIASGASGLLGGLFQNLGTFLFSVSLLCFGAVVLRMLIRKAVDG